jgi:predicted dehydrogenase
VAIVAIADPAPEVRAYAVAARNGVPVVVSSAEEMIQSSSMDAVVVSTPHALHFQQVATALHAGLHVHVDKPLAQTPAEVEELRSFALREQRLLSLHTQKKYMRGLVLMKRFLHNRFREINYLWCETRQPLYPDFAGSWRENEVLAPGGLLGDSGVHCIDTALHLLPDGLVQPVVDVRHVEHKDHAELWPVSLLSFRCGSALVSVRATRGPLDSPKLEMYNLVGDRGTLKLLYHGTSPPICDLTFAPANGSSVQQRSVKVRADYKTYPLQLFLNSLRGDRKAREAVHQNLLLAQTTAQVLWQGTQSNDRSRAASI